MNILRTFEVEKLPENMAHMHEIEHKADMKKHKMMKTVSEAFITPIEREDLVALSNFIDDITDAVEDILRQIYITDIKTLRNDMIQSVETLESTIGFLKELMKQLPDFKHSKMIDKLIVEVNDCEEKGDCLFMDSMRNLYQETDVRTIIVWKDIYQCIENCMDTCEHVADAVEMIVMKNL